MKYSEFLKSLQNRAIQPVVTFLGEEAFLKERALDAVVNRFLDEESRPFNFRSLTAEELKDASFLDEASTMPMFGEWKVLYIKDAAAIDKSYGKIKDYLEKYLDQPCSQTILIFDLDKWEGRAKLKSALSKKSTIVEFNPLSEKEIPSWINTHLKTLHFQIEASAIDMLAERLGTDLHKISAELEKLMLLRHTEKRISLKDVEETVGYNPNATVWEWSEALLEQQPERAVKLLHDLLELGEQPVYCVALLARQYEKMIVAKEMVQQKLPQATIAQKINKPAYYLQPYLNQLSRFQMDDLIKAMQVLAYTDRALKTGLGQDRTILELMTIQLCQLKEPAVPVFDVPLVL
jgi:DNA polymerase-3 subunit delta